MYSGRHSCLILNILDFLQTFMETSNTKFQENSSCGSRHDTNGKAGEEEQT